MNIKLIAIDLDGTLLDSQLKLSAENEKAVKRASASGIKIVLASGRMIRAVLPVWKKLELDTPIIGYNGAYIHDPVKNQVIYHKPVEAQVVCEVIDYAASEKAHLNLYADDEFYVEAVNEYTRYYSDRYKVPYVKVDDFRDIIHLGITKMLILTEAARALHLYDEISRIFDGRLYVTRSQERYIEMMNPEVSKGAAIRIIQEHFSMSKEETAAIGDALNDKELFKEAGLRVAVANAEEELKSAADRVIASNDEDGVALFLREAVIFE